MGWLGISWFIPRADTAHMADLFVLSTVHQTEVGAKPSLFATPTFSILYQGWIDIQAPIRGSGVVESKQ